jgi:hypothetical protein
MPGLAVADPETGRAQTCLRDAHSLTPALVHSLPAKIQDTVILAYQHALTPVFRYLVPVFALGLVLAILLPEKKLADDNGPDLDTAAAARTSARDPDGSAATTPTRGSSARK